MVPWELVEQIAIPGAAGELRLYRRGQEFSVRVGTQELMNSRQHGSEEALGRLVGQRLGTRPRSRVLVGGLGLGFTLAALLSSWTTGPWCRWPSLCRRWCAGIERS